VTATYPLMRALTRIDSEGRILLPSNIRRALRLKPNHVLELRMIGVGRSGRLMVVPRSAR
jgi:bifunctional DNA-binding transcriptional regulator/antitoxin component of YhaV-PrlF toxin-antitoxin module